MEKKKLTIKQIGLDKLIIMLLCGIFLIVLSVPSLFPTKTAKQNTTSTQSLDGGSLNDNPLYAEIQEDSDLYTNTLEDKLKNILKKVDGIGNVEVMITLKTSKELVTLKDTPHSQETMNETDGEGGSRISNNINREENSVFYTSENGETSPYIIKELEPKIEGVVVIAEGGGTQNTINEIIEAVEVLFDVPVHKIKVMKMNQ